MELNWPDILAAAGVTTGAGTLAALALGFIGQGLFGHFLKADLEDYKAKLKKEADAYKEELNKEHAKFLAGLEREGARTERIRVEIERWANPIVDAVHSLERRLANILTERAYPALRSGGQSPNPDWVITYDYFLPSTVYLFAQFFCWQRLLEQSLRFDLFRTDANKDHFLVAIRRVGEALGSWPLRAESVEVLPPADRQPFLDAFDALPPGDRQVFHLQQRAIGEALIVEKDTGPVCLSFASFQAKWNDAAFAASLAPLREFLEGLEPETRRGKRLELVRKALEKLDNECRVVLAPGRKTQCS